MQFIVDSLGCGEYFKLVFEKFTSFLTLISRISLVSFSVKLYLLAYTA